jgi:hypothetical protein
VTQPFDRAEELLRRVEDVRVRLEATEDSEQAIELLEELQQLAREVQAELERARREADVRPS